MLIDKTFYELYFRDFKLDFNNDSFSLFLSKRVCMCMFVFPMTKFLLSEMSKKLKNNSTMLHWRYCD